MVTINGKNHEPTDCFFNSMRILMSIGNFFCAIPLQGLNGVNIEEVKFEWVYWRTFINIFIIHSEILMSLMYVYGLISEGFRITNFATFLFFCNCFLSFIFLLKLSKDWVQILKAWENVEKRVNKYICEYETHLRRNIFVLTIVFSLLALVDYTSNLISQIINTINYRGETNFFEYYFVVVSFAKNFEVTPYAFWKGLFFAILNFIGVFSWTFIDVFIMANSMALNAKFRQMNYRIERYAETGVFDLYVWRIVREDYSKMCILTKLMDTKLSYLILLSCANNFHFILSQCFQTIRGVQDSGSKFYFVYSFTFVVVRTVGVYLFAASVNMESTKPLQALFSVKPCMYNIEVKRLIRFITLDIVCITGKRFFSIKRSILLDIVSAVVTYELVLVQLSKGKMDNF